jgi:hypothetical protein
MRTDVIFTTVCVGHPLLEETRYQSKGENHYFQVANILVHSVLKYSDAKIIVVTDMPDLFVEHERLIVYDIRELTDEPLIVHGYFNYHLKRIALQKAFERPETYTVYLDCDVFLSNQMPEEVFTFMDSHNYDVGGRLGGESSIRNMLEYNIPEASAKIQEFGDAWDDIYYDAILPHETFLLFKKNEEKQRKFLRTWDAIAKNSLAINRRIYADSYYIGASILNAGMSRLCFTINGTDETNNFLHNLNIIHYNCVNTIYVTEIEPFDYHALLDRMK